MPWDICLGTLVRVLALDGGRTSIIGRLICRKHCFLFYSRTCDTYSSRTCAASFSHHAAPNVHGHDPDIDTMPLLAWAEFDVDTLVDAPNTSWAKQMVSHQPYTYFLLLTFARLAWAKQSWDHAFFKTKGAGLTVRIVESMTVSLHWAWVLGSAIAALSSWQKIVAHVLVSQGACGLMLALVFSLNHNGMHIFGEEEARSVGFYRKQVVTGRDVDHTVFMNWFTGML